MMLTFEEFLKEIIFEKNMNMIILEDDHGNPYFCASYAKKALLERGFLRRAYASYMNYDQLYREF